MNYELRIKKMLSRGVRQRADDVAISQHNKRLPRSLRSLAMTSFVVILYSLFLTPQLVHAQIIPTPGTTCQDDDCRKNICPCLEREGTGGIAGECKSDKQMMCFSGKCGLNAGDAATANLPCNFTLDDIVLSTINVAQFIIGITGSLLLLFITYGGYQYVTSMGNPEGVQNAKNILTSAFVGLILIFAATLIVRFAAGLILPRPGEPGAHIPAGPRGALPKIQIGE